MNDIAILKTSDHVNNGIYFTDVCQKLVAQAFALGCSLYQACNVHKFNHCRCHLCRMIQVCQKAKSVIRNCHNAYIGVNGTERVVCRLCARLCQRIKQGTFSYIW